MHCTVRGACRQIHRLGRAAAESGFDGTDYTRSFTAILSLANTRGATLSVPPEELADSRVYSSVHADTLYRILTDRRGITIIHWV